MEPSNRKSVAKEIEALDRAIQDFIVRLDQTKLTAFPYIRKVASLMNAHINVLLQSRKTDTSQLHDCFVDFRTQHSKLLSAAVGRAFQNLEKSFYGEAETFNRILFEGGSTRCRFQELLLKGDIISKYSTRFRIAFEKIQTLPHGGFPPARES